MKSIIFGILVFLFLGSTAYAQETKPALKIEVSVKYVGINPPDTRPVINTLVRITNVSKEDIRMSEWTCSYQKYFITDNPYVTPVEATCVKNLFATFILKPDQTLEWPLQFMVSFIGPKDNIYFKVGYKARRLADAAKNPSPSATVAIEGSPFWSNAEVARVR